MVHDICEDFDGEVCPQLGWCLPGGARQANQLRPGRRPEVVGRIWDMIMVEIVVCKARDQLLLVARGGETADFEEERKLGEGEFRVRFLNLL